MTIYGYIRVSTKNQKLERQETTLKEIEKNIIIFKEKYTGTEAERPEWCRLLKRVKEGDTIIFDSVSRMMRNADEGIKQYFELYNKGVRLVFVNEGFVNTDVYKESVNKSIEMTGNEIADCYIEATNKVLKIIAEKQIRLAFEQAQKENDDRRRSIKKGMAETKKRNEEIRAGVIKGKELQIGQRKGAKLHVKKADIAKGIIKRHSADFGGTLNDIECIKLTGLSRNTYYKYKKELKEEN